MIIPDRGNVSALCLAAWLLAAPLSAAFDPDQLVKSTVKVMVKAGGKTSMATGFVWGNTAQVVTSLHVMRPGGEIIVEYNNVKRKASISKILTEADLVLLNVAGSSPGWTALKAVDSKVDHDEVLYALGYNRGADDAATRRLRKGWSQSGKLRGLVPKHDLDHMEKLCKENQWCLPSLDLEILYLEGSLLPGFSGSPILDTNNKLVGIGDGGLEEGASNVSWGIPASQLAKLSVSQETSLPSGFTASSRLFSAAVEIDSEELREASVEVRLGDLTFVKTKTRTLAEILATTEDPTTKAFLKYLGAYDIDFSRIKYDIYEEVDKGIIIAVPFGRRLEAKDGYVEVNYDSSSDYQLRYSVLDGPVAAPSLFSESNYNDRWSKVEDDFKELAYSNKFGDGTKIERKGYHWVAEGQGIDIRGNRETTEFSLYYYQSRVTGPEGLTVYAEALLNHFFDREMREMMGRCETTDCQSIDSSFDCFLTCNRLEEMVRILGSIHLTRYYKRAGG